MENKNEIIEIFGEEGFNYYECMVTIRNSRDDWDYLIVPDNEYINRYSFEDQHKAYWLGMCYRCHITALVSLFRNLRWIDAMTEARKAGNLYSFTSSLRGLIESIGDSFYTTRNITPTIANDFYAIKKILNKESNIVITHKKLEDELIHFTHAQNLDKITRKQPDNNTARFSSRYITAIKMENPEIEDLYSYLHRISHPSVISHGLLLFRQYDKMIVSGDSFELENDLISLIITEKQSALINLLRIYCINIFEILKLLNLFELDELNTRFPFENKIDHSKTWMDISDMIERSEIKYNNAQDSGKYE